MALLLLSAEKTNLGAFNLPALSFPLTLPLSSPLTLEALYSCGDPDPPLKLSLLWRPDSDDATLSLSNANPSFSETGVIVPDADLADLRSKLEVTSLETALRRCLVAKFLLPSTVEVGFALSSSMEGGPRGWRIGCEPLAWPGAKVAVRGVEGSMESLGKEVLGAGSISRLLMLMQVERELALR